MSGSLLNLLFERLGFLLQKPPKQQFSFPLYLIHLPILFHSLPIRKQKPHKLLDSSWITPFTCSSYMMSMHWCADKSSIKTTIYPLFNPTLSSRWGVKAWLCNSTKLINVQAKTCRLSCHFCKKCFWLGESQNSGWENHKIWILMVETRKGRGKNEKDWWWWWLVVLED